MAKKLKSGVLTLLSKRQRKGLVGSERYRLIGTYFFLSKVQVGTQDDGSWIGCEIPVMAWRCFRFSGSKYRGCGSIDEFLEKSYCPTELLFNLDILSKLT